MKLEEILEHVKEESSSYVLTVSYLDKDRKSVITKCLASNFPVNDLATARSEASNLIYNLQEDHENASSENGIAEGSDDKINDQVKGLLG